MIDWEQLRTEAALNIMANLVSTMKYPLIEDKVGTIRKQYAKASVDCADSLIEELKNRPLK